MSKTFWIFISILVITIATLITVNTMTKSQEEVLGIRHESQGQNHVAKDEKHDAYNSDLPSSGPHYEGEGAPADWGVYMAQIIPEVYIHNIEHGGVVIAYNPDMLPATDLAKLRALFTQPFSNKAFSPKKFILMPRTENTSTIQLASWTYTLSLENYNEATIIKFFEQHAGNAPEAMAGPNNEPINQVAPN